MKIIKVNPGSKTSLQLHNKRTEIHLKLGKPFYKKILPEEPHQMTEGLYLEVAWGEPEEDDIERFNQNEILGI